MALYFCSLVLLSLTAGYTMAHISEVKVTAPDVSLPPVSAPLPTPGGELSPSPSRGWGLVSGADPSPAPDTFPLVPKERTHSRSSHAPSGAPGDGDGDGIPFISSNPSVPLPTGVTDTASSHPLPTPGDRNDQVVGLGSVCRVQRALLASVTMFAAALVLWM